MEAKYVATALGEPILSWVTMNTISLSFISSVYKYVVKAKVVI